MPIVYRLLMHCENAHKGTRERQTKDREIADFLIAIDVGKKNAAGSTGGVSFETLATVP
jgi:hypothetical protein